MGIGVTALIGSCLGNSNASPISILFLMGAQKECSDAVGVLVFLTWDVLSAAWEPIDKALAAVHTGAGGPAPAVRYGALFTAGLTVGLVCSAWWGMSGG